MELKENNNSVLLKKVFDAGANTIWSEMRKLRGQPEELKGNIRRRWIWELIQNASDCTKEGGKINIEVLIENNLLKFKHDGLPFVYENLVDLITQISSKQRSEDKKTGKFGTGFISTHLLSEKVGIKGILKENDDYKELKFILDRSGTSYEEIRNQIESNLNDIEKLKSDDSKIIDEPSKNETVFVYKIAELEDTTSAVRIGLDDLKNTIAYVLALNESIQSITSENITYEVFDINHDQEIGCKIVTVKDSNEITYDVLVKQGKKTSIAIGVVSNKDGTYKVLPLDKNIPKLFCKFPLIGTENFSFPVIINSSEFDIEKDRNAIHEGNEENIQIIDEAIELYRIVIEEACKSKWLDLYNLCNLNKNTDSSLQKKNNEVVRDIYENLDIVDTNLYGKYAGKYHIKEFDYIKNEEVPQILIPYTKIEYREEFWELINDLGCYRIPTKESYIQWHTIFQKNLSVESINNFLNSFGKLCEFEKYYCSKKYDVFEWLSRYYTIWIKSKGKDSFLNEIYVLNQKLEFVKGDSIYLDISIDEKLKDILYDLGEDIRETLLIDKINLPEGIITKYRDNQYVVTQIQKKINGILSEETVENTPRSKETQQIFNKITDWFLEKPTESEKLFTTLYNKRTLLATLEENIRRFKIAEKIESNNIAYEELDGIIEDRYLISDLINNMDNLDISVIRQKLKYISKNSGYGKDYFIKIMNRSIENVFLYLKSSELYTVSNTLDEWKEDKFSKTVFKAIKDEKEIFIVIRPSDDDKIIFFYEEEVEALDNDSYELWTDDGKGNIRTITLGDIIKTTGISVIPLKNIF